MSVALIAAGAFASLAVALLLVEFLFSSDTTMAWLGFLALVCGGVLACQPAGWALPKPGFALTAGFLGGCVLLILPFVAWIGFEQESAEERQEQFASGEPRSLQYGVSRFVGKQGVTAGLMNPGGIVVIDGERQHAESSGLTIAAGVGVEVVALRRNLLIVKEIATVNTTGNNRGD